MRLVRVVKNWQWPSLNRQSPHCDGVWGDWQFTEDAATDCDGLLVLNRPMKPVKVRCPADNVWALLQEPDQPEVHDWMREGHDAYQHVFTHAPPSRDARYIRSQPAVPWHVGRDYAQLQGDPGLQKSPVPVWITSDLKLLPGHRRRMSLLGHLRSIDPGQSLVRVYGRGIRPVADKWTVLGPAMYSVAVESATQPDYWTEKLADCFLADTLPLYHGCPNICDYFPEDALIRIDPTRPDDVVALLRALPQSGEWQRRRTALAEARRLVLEKYQFFPWMVTMLERVAAAGPAVEVELEPWRASWPTRWRNFSARWSRRFGLAEPNPY